MPSTDERRPPHGMLFLNIFRFLGHFIFVGGAVISAYDFHQLAHRFPGTWDGILFLGISAILGFPWSLVIVYAGVVVVAIAPVSQPAVEAIYPGILFLGLFINYAIFLWITGKMKRRLSPLKANAA
jgi:hypothetical protein